jgi:hypothetical protein
MAMSTDVSGATTLPNYTGKFTTYFDTDSSSTYTLRFSRPTNAGLNAAVLNVANVIVGPGIQPQGADVEEWIDDTTAFTSVLSSGYGTITQAEFKRRRIGDTMEVYGYFKSGTVTATNQFFQLPSGFTIDQAKLSSTSNVNRLGTGHRVITSGTFIDFEGEFQAFYDGSTNNQVFFTPRMASNAFVKRGVSSDLANSDGFTFRVWIPIAEWSGSGTINLAQNDVEYLTNTNTSTSSSDTTTFSYGPAGTAIVAISSAGITIKKRVRAQHPMGANAGRPKLQVSPDGTLWLAAESQFMYTEAGSQKYGMRLTAGGTASTDIDVEFGGDGANGTEAWSTYTSWFWRVIMEQPGVAVGFGTADASNKGLVTSYTPVTKSKVKTVSSANYTVTDSDGYDTILVATGSVDRTITLPAVATNAGRTLTIKKTDAGSGVGGGAGFRVLIDTPGSETIDGAAQNYLSEQYSYVTLVCDGSNWSVIACCDWLEYQHSTSSAGISVSNAYEDAFYATAFTFAAADVNTTNDTITHTTHGLLTGQVLNFASSEVTLPSPLAVSTAYYVIVVDANTIKLATSYANAIAGTQIDITTTGTGSHTLRWLAVLEVTPGEWDLCATWEIDLGAATSTTAGDAFIATAANNTSTGRISGYNNPPVTPISTSAAFAFPIAPAQRVRVTTNTLYYQKMRVTFTTGSTNPTYINAIRARRVG